MAGILPSRILVHTATPVSFVEGVAGDEWIEGEPGEGGPVRTDGTPFPCVLFLPSPGGAEANPYRPRVVRRPTLLFNPSLRDGTPVVVTDRMELMINAPELTGWTNGVNPARWQADGDAQPFGPPGRVLGIMASLVQVQD